jgi:hypothetical protein
LPLMLSGTARQWINDLAEKLHPNLV